MKPFLVKVPGENVATWQAGNQGAPDQVTVATTPGQLAGPFEVVDDRTEVLVSRVDLDRILRRQRLMSSTASTGLRETLIRLEKRLK